METLIIVFKKLEHFLTSYGDCLPNEQCFELQTYITKFKPFLKQQVVFTLEDGKHFENCPYALGLKEVPDTCECLYIEKYMDRVTKIINKFELLIHRLTTKS